MSIVTLKKKTQAKYNNVSVGQSQFSLNGIRRLQGYVGQTSLSRNLPKTIKKGDTAQGYGGCCGQYQRNEISPAEIWSTEDNTTVKSSVLSQSGHLRTQYEWNCPPTWKPDTNQINSSSVYTQFVTKSTIQEYNQCDNTAPPVSYTTNCNRPSAKCSLSKNPTTITQSEYIENITQSCTTAPSMVIHLDRTPVLGS